MKTDKLELKHLSPYLPYGLKVQNKDGYIRNMNGLDLQGDPPFTQTSLKPKPILRNLSDLTKEIEHNGEKFVPLDRLISRGFALANYRKLPYGDMEKLFEYHFDIFGLIEKGLAIDVNKLSENPYK